MKKLILPLILFTFIFQGCTTDSLTGDDERPNELPRTLTSSEQDLIQSGNAFSFNIFDKVVASEDNKNVFISPLSISMALGMTLNGAAGSTQTGIEETLGMEEMQLQAINQSYQSLIKLLVELDPKVEMNIGNSLWGREGFAIQQSFKDTLQTYFNARADELDFADPAAAGVINNWVSEQTNGRIEKIIEGPIPRDIVLYLINTVYFKGDWLYQFDEEDTRSSRFTLADESTVEVDMMSQDEMPLAYIKSDEVHMAELAYGDSLYKMTVLMPGQRDMPIESFISESLTAANLSEWTAELQTRPEAIMKLPKFESEYGKKLNDILKTMGMEQAFDKFNAQFPNINPNGQLYISEVQHKANITVNEEGSEAAAATSVSVGVTSIGPHFFVDRPFVYLIRERISGTVLFMGMMKNPAE